MSNQNTTTKPFFTGDNSISTIASTVVPYYGSREPKQSVIETDRVIFQMMDDIQITVQPKLNKQEGTSKWLYRVGIYTKYIIESLYGKEDSDKLVPVSTTRNGLLWKFRIVFSSIIILLLVVGTFLIMIITYF
jgi:hypothetical protein